MPTGLRQVRYLAFGVEKYEGSCMLPGFISSVLSRAFHLFGDDGCSARRWQLSRRGLAVQVVGRPHRIYNSAQHRNAQPDRANC